MPGSRPDDLPEWKLRALERVRAGDLCPACLGVEWVRAGEFAIDHPRFGMLEPCPICTKGRVPEYLRQASGLAGWAAKATFENYIETSARSGQLDAARELVARGSGWLTMWGGHGRGKSYLLAAIVNESLAQRRPAVYVGAGRLLDHLRDAYKPGGLGYSDAFRHWCDCQVLAVDEAEVFHQTSWAADKYRQLLDYRYMLACDGQTITVFASNLQPGGPDWPEELYWLASRMGQFEVIEAKGGDIRPKLGDAVPGGHWSDDL